MSNKFEKYHEVMLYELQSFKLVVFQHVILKDVH
jgi:hypothetical protein